MKFAYDDNSVINSEYKENLTNKDEMVDVISFLIRHYVMYGYSEQTENIRNKIFGLSVSN